MVRQESSSFYGRLANLTVFDGLQLTAGRLPEKIAVVDGERHWTYSEILQSARELAGGLAELGLRRGDVAAVYMKNSVELVTLFYALQKLGVVIAWINPNYRENEALFVLREAEAKCAFVFAEWEGFNYLDALQSLRGELPSLERIVVAGSLAGGRPEGVIALEDLPGKASHRPPDGEVSPRDLSMLLFTSGTTGIPKGAMITQEQALRAGLSYSIAVDAVEDDIFIAFLPLSHSYGCGALLLQPFILGATVVLLDKFSPEAAFRLIEREKVTVQLAAPAHYILELNSRRREEYDLSSLRAGTIAGQIAPPGLITRVQEEMGIYISSFLGSSEVGPGLSIILPYGSALDLRERCIGYPLEGTQARVADPVTGEEKGTGEPGELLLSGWHVTQGYWKKPEETAHQIRDGWLHTGDLASCDENGCFSIHGRLKEWINRGGFKIIPSELESLLAAHPAVSEVCVVGTPNPVLGESICACLVLKEDGLSLDLDEVRCYLEGQVADFKLPDELLVLPEFPRMPGGLKLNRFGPGGVVEQAKSSDNKQVRHR